MAYLKAILFSLVVIFGLTEVSLRTFPTLIPVNLLINFQKDLRKNIAKKRKFQTIDDTLPYAENSEGPSVLTYKPYARIQYDYKDPGIVNTMQMDGLGCCNEPLNLYHQKNKFDVIAVGDSFTWFTTIEATKTWPSQLAHISGLSLYNLGLPGRGPHEYLALIKRFALKKNPKMIIMAIYEGNDLGSIWTQNQKQLDYSDACLEVGLRICKGYSYLKNYVFGFWSYAFNFYVQASLRVVSVFHQGTFFSQQARPIYLSDGSFNHFQYSVRRTTHQVDFNPYHFDVDVPNWAKKLKEGILSLELYEPILRDFVRLSREHKFIPVVIYLPTVPTAYMQYVQFKYEDQKLKEVLTFFNHAQTQYLMKKSNLLGCHFIDLTSALKLAAQKYEDDILYFREHIHFTQK